MMSERSTWWSGAIALVVLAALTLTLEPPAIERDVTERVLAALDAGDYPWSTINVSGRDVVLFGQAPDASSAARIVADVRAVPGVRAVREQIQVSATPPRARARPAQAMPERPAPPDYTARERAALGLRVTAETCQRLFDGLLATRSVQFDAASAVIDRSSVALLEHLATAAVHCPDTRLTLAGHTDDSGLRRADQRLSEERARAVAEYLVSRGVRRQRLSVVGYGSERPVADDTSPHGRELNRRIEITVEN